MATILTPDWNATDWHANHLAVHREDLIGQSGQQELSLLRHPSYPFLAEISADPSTLFAELCSVAEDYLRKVALLDDLHDDPLRIKAIPLLTRGDREGFGWLPITWDWPDGLIDPRGSFVVRRRSPSGYKLDQTVVLMAGNRSLKGDKIQDVDGLAVGLRVVMHADPPTHANRVPIRVTGTSVSELRRARDPKASEAKRIQRFLPFLRRFALFIEQSLDFSPQTVKVSGFEQLNVENRDDVKLLRVAGVGARPRHGLPRGFLWNVEIGLEKRRRTGRRIAFLSVREQEQYTHALEPEAPLQLKLFFRDPASCGGASDIRSRFPTRDEEVLDRFRKDACLPSPLEDRAPVRFEVLQSFIADPQNDRTKVQSINPDDLPLPLRSDHLSAAQAFLRAQEFFTKLSDFDLPENAYFKFARLPLLMRHRAAFDAHPDGKAVIAQVRVVGSPVPFREYDPPTDRATDARPQLEVAFGSAELRHRAVYPDDHRRPSAQPLGLAADPRWAWHEFGHVLSYAATGALEYEFAHSVGDALAAVLNDATSCLAGDPLYPLYEGETYPWVPAGRRHDRDAAAGWCWCGRRNGQRHAAPSPPLPLLYKGYVEEQMLSSSVFRLYRAIGGHPKNDSAMRERAAAAAAYLLMRSASLLGPGALVPARSADALVSAMVDADIGTRRPGDLFLGGCLHKVVRWAFERQGLFATACPNKNVEGPGLPPAVDLWVMDRRPNAKDGGYEQVTLEWPRMQPEPDWFADPREGVWEDASGNIHVIVRNRGTRDATDVAVRAWLAPAGPGPLQWHPLGDHRLATVPSGGCAPACIAPSGEKHYLLADKHYLLVEVSASEDASNLDERTRLPCAARKPPDQPEAVRDLVANDNNLALRLIS
jgi:hypothetical protein